ncbi:MAG: DUF779 domain-containing protein [Candidatus Binatia bacterium]
MPVVRVSEAAERVLARVRADRSGDLSITLDGGCCEGSAPHLYENYVVPFGAKEIGRAGGIPVFLPPGLIDLYEDADILIDVVDDPISDAMSLETSYGRRLVIREGPQA